MNDDDRKKAWDELIPKLMKSKKYLPKYGFTDSLQSHYKRFEFYRMINEFPSIQLAQKEELSNNFLSYLKKIDEEIENGLLDIEYVRFYLKVFLDMYCNVLLGAMLQKYIDLIKSGKTNDEQIIADFAEEYLGFLLKGFLETKKDRQNILEIFRRIVNTDKPLEKLNEIKLLVSTSLLGHSPTLDSTQVEKLIQDTIQAKKDQGTSPSQNTYLKNEVQNTAIESLKSPKLLKPIKTFPEYLLHDKRELLADKLKTEFNTERGKGIRLMIDALQENEPKLLHIGNRQKKEVFEALDIFFNRDIGSYQSIFDCIIGEDYDKAAMQATKSKLNFILGAITK